MTLRTLDIFVIVLLFVWSMGLFRITLAPDVLGADSGEFQFVPYVLGIAHPPGYPLYTLVGKLFTLLPVGSVAFRMNLMSAVFGALGVSFVYACGVWLVNWTTGQVSRVTARVVAGRVALAVGALSLAVSAAWWSQSTMAAVRTLNGFFLVVTLYLAFRWAATGERKWLRWLAFAFGLSLTHHISQWTLGLAFIVFVLIVNWREIANPRRLLEMLCCFASPLLVFLYLPIRSAMGAPFDVSKPTTIASFLNLVFAKGFQSDMFAYGLEDMPARIDLARQLILTQFGWVTLVVAGIGLLACLLWARKGLMLLLFVAAINVLISVTYRAPVITDYLIPTYIVIAVLVGFGVWTIGRGAASWLGHALPWSWVAALIVGLVGLVMPWHNLVLNYDSLNLSDYTQVREMAESALNAAAPDSTILADWHDSTALWYCQLAEGLRPDVEVVYAHPDLGKSFWLNHTNQLLEQGVLYLTDYQSEVAEAYRLHPVGSQLLHVSTGPEYEEPSEETVPGYRPVGASFAGKVMLLGYKLASDNVLPGDKLRVVLYWKALQKTERPWTAFVQLVGANGKIWGQRDGYPAKGFTQSTEWNEGEIIADEREFPLLMDVPPGEYSLVAGLYDMPAPDEWRLIPSEEGVAADAIRLGDVTVGRRTQWPVAPQFSSNYSFGELARLEGYEVTHWSETSLGLSLYWKALGESKVNRKVSLTVEDDQGVTLGKANSHPVSGLHPTSQWQEGDLIIDHYEVRLTDKPSGDLRVVVGLSSDQSEGGENRLSAQESAVLRIPAALDDPGKVRVNFGNKALLTGWRVEPADARAGETVNVCLDWLPLTATTDDCSVFVHLIDAYGQIKAQHDGVPVAGGYPTLRWIRGREVEDCHRMELGSDVSPGKYYIQIGMYVMRTMERLSVLDRGLAEEGQADRVVLDTVEVSP